MHQQPPQTPPLASTSVAKSAQVSGLERTRRVAGLSGRVGHRSLPVEVRLIGMLREPGSLGRTPAMPEPAPSQRCDGPPP